MFWYRTILTLFALLVFTAGSTGMPQLIHMCCDVPQAAACDPMECCDDDEEAASDDCCTDELTVQNVDDDGTLASSTTIPEPSQLDAGLKGYTSSVCLFTVPVGRLDDRRDDRRPENLTDAPRLQVFLI